jgi:gliding motility-associated-like protein
VNFIQQTPANGGTGGDECDKDFILNAIVTPGTGTWTQISGPGNAVFTPDNHQPDATVTVDTVGAYNFAWTVVNIACTSSDYVTVVFHDLPSVNAGNDTIICESSSVQLEAQGAGSFAWLPADLVDDANIVDPVATPVTTTVFTVTLTDQFGCQNFDEVKVELWSQPVADAGPDRILEYLFDTELEAVPINLNETGTWSVISGSGQFSDPDASVTSLTGLALGENILLWRVTNGVCPDANDYITILVNDLVIPTLITPNGDKFNQYFELRGITTLGKTELTIFDRRGVQVYRNTNYDNLWNGVDYNGNDLPDDTYFYVIKSQNGKSLSGYIVIRR